MAQKKQPPKPINLSDEQRAAVETTEGALAIIAGPGSGKSSVLIARYLRLLEQSKPEDVLALTFTSEAAKSLRERAEARLPYKIEPKRTSGAMTFHSLALAFTVQELGNFPFTLQPFPLATEGQAAKFIGETARRCKLDFRELQSWISLQKRNVVRPAEALKAAEEGDDDITMALAYKEYDGKLRDAGLLDFDSLLVEMYTLLVSSPEIRLRWSFKFIMVDEFQDTDELQMRILKLLAKRWGNICAVGDINQGIYSWRGASYDVLLKFAEHFPGAKTLYLNNNYRATKALTDFNYQIAPFQPPDPYRSQNEDGVPPVIRRYLNSADEAKGVVDLIRSELGRLL